MSVLLLPSFPASFLNAPNSAVPLSRAADCQRWRLSALASFARHALTGSLAAGGTLTVAVSVAIGRRHWGASERQARVSVQRRGPLSLLLLGVGSCWPGQAAASSKSSLEDAPRGAVVLLHGSGDSGDGLRRYLQAVDGGKLLHSLQENGVELYFPNSAVRPYSLAGGRKMSVWYDRTGLPPSAPESTESVEASVRQLLDVLDQIRAQGVPPERTIVGGFSMGGGIALQLSLRHPGSVAGAFVLSSFLCDDAAAYGLLENPGATSLKRPPVLMVHGKADNFIQPQWGQATAKRLKRMGLDVTFELLPGVRHELVPEELSLLGEWLSRFLPIRASVGDGEL